MVGPTVAHMGETGALWTDHTDIRPTMLSILGLPSDYEQDGSAVSQFVDPSALPLTVANHEGAYQALQDAYSQLNAAVGEFGHASEIVSTTASLSSSNSVYDGFNAQLAACQAARTPLVNTIKADLNDVVFGDGHVVPGQWKKLAAQADALIGDMQSLAQDSTPPAQMVCS
jgi:hypothetical protein